MKIIVCVKQVPNTNEVKIDPVKGTMIREGVPSILNPDDANALEAALQFKDKVENTTVTVLTMGPSQADVMLRECLAMGADDAILLSDRAFAGADTWATSNTLAGAIRKMGGADIVFAGRQAIDGDTAQVGPQIAMRLGIPQVTYVKHVEMNGDTLTVHRQMEDGYEVIEIKMPCLLTAVKELNTPRYMRVSRIYDAYERKLTVWGLENIGLPADQVGLKASPTRVFKSFSPPLKGQGQVFSGPPKEIVSKVLAEMKAKHLI